MEKTNLGFIIITYFSVFEASEKLFVAIKLKYNAVEWEDEIIANNSFLYIYKKTFKRKTITNPTF